MMGLALLRSSRFVVVARQTSRSFSILPTRHSRHEIAPTCLDEVELSELTDELLSSKEGSLFWYDQSKTTTWMVGEIMDDRQEAWDRANETVQKMEYVIQGHAARIPGSLWNRWTYSDDTNEEETDNASLEKMGQLLDRAWLEGSYYMRVRKEHLSQLAWEQGVDIEEEISASAAASASSDFPEWKTNHEEDTSQDVFVAPATTPQEMEEVFRNVQEELKKVVHEDYNATTIEEENFLEMTSDNDDDQNDNDYDTNYSQSTTGRDLNMDFALPGPTVAMYDAFFDGMAVAQEKPLSPLAVLELLVMVLERHTLDGGDANNTNPHTLPTRITFNAPIRLCATTQDADNRDEALVCAFSSYNALAHSGLDVNCATYKYLLQVVKQFVPPSRSRGHMVHGLWSHARLKGLLDAEVWEAVRQAHEPSNGDEFDSWLEQYKDKTYMDVDQRWRRRIKVHRQFANETTY